jgi:hypothetical protein
MPQYLDANGNPIAAPTQKTYLDDNGEPIKTAATTDTRSFFQKAKDNFNANTQGAKPGDGAVKGFIENIGEGGGQAIRAIAHPLDTISAMGHTVAHPLDEAHAEVDAVRADPSRFIGNTIGQAGTGAILGEAAGAGAAALAPKILPIAGRVALLGKTPEAAYESALKPSTTLSPAERASVIKTGLQNEIPISKGGLEKLGEHIDTLNQAIKDEIASDPNRPIDANKVASRADQARARFANQVNAQGDLDAIEASKQQFLKEQAAKMPPPPVHPNSDLLYHGTNQELSELHPKSFVTDDPKEALAYALRRTSKPLEGDGTERIYSVPKADVQATGTDVLEGKHYLTESPHAVQDVTREVFNDGADKPVTMNAADAQSMKQGTYQVLKGKFGEQGSASVEAQKSLARGLKEEIATQFPEISKLNADESRLLDLQPVLERAVNRISNHQAIGIGTPIAGAAAKAVTGSGGVGVVASVLKGVLDNPGVKSRLAIAISKSSKIPIGQAMEKVTAYSAAIGATVASSQAYSSGDNPSQPTTPQP